MYRVIFRASSLGEKLALDLLLVSRCCTLPLIFWLRENLTCVTKVIYFSERESSGTACGGAELDSHCEPKVKTDVSCREKLTCH